MSRLIDRPLTAEEYEDAAWAYHKTLPMEHFMESIPQSTQRKIALESLDVLHARRSEVQVFSELLIQYLSGGELRRVVPDNMVRLYDQPPLTKGSYNIELEPVGILWVLEWVSSSSEGKDYGEAFDKYERDLKVPYCLMFHPEEQDFRIYKHTGKRYRPIPANAVGRHPIPDLDLEVGVLDGWVRFWHQDELIALPGAMERRIQQLQAEAAREKGKAEDERRLRIAAEDEVARLRAELAKARSGKPKKPRKKK